MLRLAFSCLVLSIACLSVAPRAFAQEVVREVVVPQENVRFDYAQVLSVSPIYQTLRATRMERVCDVKQPSANGLSRVVSVARGEVCVHQARMLACCAAACKARPAQGLLVIGCGVIETRTRRRLPGSSAKRVRNLLPL